MFRITARACVNSLVWEMNQTYQIVSGVNQIIPHMTFMEWEHLWPSNVL